VLLDTSGLLDKSYSLCDAVSFLLMRECDHRSTHNRPSFRARGVCSPAEAVNAHNSICALRMGPTATWVLILIKFDSQSCLLYSVPELDHNPIM